MQGVHPDMSAAQMRLLTAKLTPKELTALKKLMLRPGFVEEWESLDTLAAGFAKKLLSKENATPSSCYKFFLSYDPEAVLWLGFTSKDLMVKERFNLFLKVWPEVRQRIPHALMQEMRITPELPAYREVVEKIFLELLDGKLATPEEARAFLEPYSPPAPPPQVVIKRTRAKRSAEAKMKEHSFEDEEESEEVIEEDEDLDDIGGDDEDLDLGMNLPKSELSSDLGEDSEVALGEDEEEEEEIEEEAPEPSVKRGSKQPKPAAAPVEAKKPAPAPAAPKQEKTGKAAPAPKPKAEPKPEPRPVPPAKAGSAAKPKAPAAAPKAQAAPVKAAAKESKKPAPSAKSAPAKPAVKAVQKKPVQKPAVKPAAKPAAKPAVKAPTKAPAARPAPAKKKPNPAVSSKMAKAGKASPKKSASKEKKKR